MTNKLVVIIKSKVPKIEKILLYETKFLVPNYSCLQNPWLGGCCPQIRVLSVLNWICWTPPPEKIPAYAAGIDLHLSLSLSFAIVVFVLILKAIWKGPIVTLAEDVACFRKLVQLKYMHLHKLHFIICHVKSFLRIAEVFNLNSYWKMSASRRWVTSGLVYCTLY